MHRLHRPFADVGAGQVAVAFLKAKHITVCLALLFQLADLLTMDMGEQIATHYGLRTINVLTGFKFIGEQIGKLEKQGKADSYVFGFEERIADALARTDYREAVRLLYLQTLKQLSDGKRSV